jgi:threonine synthase
MKELVSTLTGRRYPFGRIEEFTEDGESLEVRFGDLANASLRTGKYLWERFGDFLPFSQIDADISLGEGQTALLPADRKLAEYTGLDRLWLKNETQNPTWSFKDRGSLTCIAMAREMDEQVTATISTGNMGNSIAAYAAKADLRAIVFVPGFTPKEKIMAMGIHGATVLKVHGPDYSVIKKHILDLAGELSLRVVSGNGPIRVEGYKMIAFELLEQMEGEVPDYIAIPTSACGHTRGVFKGYRELKEAGLIHKIPKMIVVQARNNSPIVSAIKQGKKQVIPFTGFHTVAEAITTGNPMGGDEIIDKAARHGWLAEDVTEEEILDSQRRLAASGYFVEPATATSLSAIRKLRASGKLDREARVVMMLTGSGLKDTSVLGHHRADVRELELPGVALEVRSLLGR